MADLSITASAVAVSNNTTTSTKQGTAGATITAGQVLYIDPATSTLKPAKTLDVNTSAAVGIALNSASSGQPVDYVVQDPAFTIGATLTRGQIIMLSASTAGGFLTQAPTNGSGEFNTIVGIAISTTQAKVRFNSIQQAGVAV